MKAAGKVFTLATCILQASVARRLACLKRTPVITLAKHTRGVLGVFGIVRQEQGASTPLM